MTLRETSRGLRKTEQIEVRCPRCRGTGEELYGNGRECFRCDGRGFVYREQEIRDPREDEQ